MFGTRPSGAIPDEDRRTKGDDAMICDVCGNDYDKPLEIAYLGGTYVFDSFECAIHVIAPECDHCRCKIIGHGVENSGKIFCCANCARESGENRLRDRV